MEDHEIKKIVRDRYGKVAKSASCCGPSEAPRLELTPKTTNTSRIEITPKTTNTSCSCSSGIGYTLEDIESIPEGADLGLGCGNPTASADLKKGETVLDLGSGGGIDCFLAANKVGGEGKVIGVDMTPDMIDVARENALKRNYENVEFRLGEIENLPVADNYVDVIISNCVINLSTDKDKVFQEAYRVLKPNGRMLISDIVLTKEIPESLRNNPDAYAGCIAGAILKEEYLQKIANAGFKDISVIEESTFPETAIKEDPDTLEKIEKSSFTLDDIKSVLAATQSIKVKAIKKP